MATKLCCYKDCESCSIQGDVNDTTLFRFPKEPSRFAEWTKLSGCHELIPPHERYLCSKHFDAGKYIARNNRRSVLLSSAIPFPCESKENNCSTLDPEIEEEEESVQREIEIEHYDDEKESCDSPEILEDALTNCRDELESQLIEEIRDETITSTESTNGIAAKRKIDENISYAKTKRTSLLKSSMPKSPIELQRHSTQTVELSEEQKTNDHSSDSDTDNRKSQVSIFMFKNQEYIQMPKADYDNERSILLKKIKLYEQVLDNIKNSVNNLNIC